MIVFDVRKDIDSQFDSIAKDLFNNKKLIVNNSEYYITEIEFYVYNRDYHPDSFVHKNDEQLTSNKWYFHGSGLDITIGDGVDTHGGILIRGLKTIVGDHFHYFDGPLNIIREIFSKFELKSSNQFFGVTNSTPKKNKIVKITRIGLNAKGKIRGVEFAKKNYRYLIDLTTIHKYKEKEYTTKNSIEL